MQLLYVYTVWGTLMQYTDSHLQVSIESENLCTIISTASLVVSKYLNTRHTVRLECVCKVIPPLLPYLSSL